MEPYEITEAGFPASSVFQREEQTWHSVPEMVFVVCSSCDISSGSPYTTNKTQYTDATGKLIDIRHPSKLCSSTFTPITNVS